MASLILDKVNYIYNPGTTFQRHALKDIDLVIPEDSFIGLIGHTGSGKSTLIQHLNGLIRCTSGTIFFNGQDISDKDFDLKSLRSKVGLVFQYPEHQLFETTVEKDVLFGPKNQGLSKLEAQKRAYDALAAVGLGEEFLDASPFELSGGQKRKVAIAGVLAMKPDILILDEPAAGLDPVGRRNLLEMIKRIREEQRITVIMVSHSMEDVAEYVDRIIVMNDGAVFMDDEPRAIFRRHDELEKIGLAAPTVTYLMEAVKSKGLDVNTDIYTINEAAEELLK